MKAGKGNKQNQKAAHISPTDSPRGGLNTNINQPSIAFSSHSRANQFLSNFYQADFLIDGKRWRTVEHFYQASKFLDAEFQEKIRVAATALEAKKLGSSRSKVLRADWEDYRLEVMRRGVLAKFKQNPDLTAQLIQTGDCLLVESTPDEFWGIGRNGNGLNKLGAILVDVRAILKANYSENVLSGCQTDQEVPKAFGEVKGNKSEGVVDQAIVPECEKCVTYLSTQLLTGLKDGGPVVAFLEETFERLRNLSDEYFLRPTTGPKLLEGARHGSILRFLGSPEQKPGVKNQRKVNIFFMWTLYRDDGGEVFGVSIISHNRKFDPMRIFHTTDHDTFALCARRTKEGGLCLSVEGGPKVARTRNLNVGVVDGCAIFQARLRSFWADSQ